MSQVPQRSPIPAASLVLRTALPEIKRFPSLANGSSADRGRFPRVRSELPDAERPACQGLSFDSLFNLADPFLSFAR